VPIRFTKRFKIAPGVTVNLGKSGTSLSMGPRGAKTTIGHGRLRRSIGLPGTGLSYSTTTKLSAPPSADEVAQDTGAASPHVVLYAIAAVVGAGIAFLATRGQLVNLPTVVAIGVIAGLVLAWMWVHHHTMALAMVLIAIAGLIVSLVGVILSVMLSPSKRR
jgi:hypothetical protein